MYPIIKRIFDFVLALLLVILLSPVMLVCAVVIKIEDKGAVLFRQQRPGLNEKIFTVYKFRTMSTQTQKDGVALSDMDRMTRVGKVLRMFSLDELPQLVNVLKGDMSFIGPRPLLVEYLDRYNSEQKRRHNVRPGISGWAQVNGRNAISWEEKFKLDCWYVDNMCIKTDIKILFMTVRNTLKREGINSGENVTMEPFTGNTAQITEQVGSR